VSLSLKRTVHVSKDVDLSFSVAELAEKFTDDQLRTVGLYRDLRDADIERLQVLDREVLARAAMCDDEDCECECHQHRSRTVRRGKPKHDAESEHTFWSAIRTSAQRHDIESLVRLLEQRAWNVGGVTVDFSHLRAKG